MLKTRHAGLRIGTWKSVALKLLWPMLCVTKWIFVREADAQ